MRPRGQQGVTMLELLIAMFLLAIALLGLAAAFPYAMQGVVAGGFQTTATLLAQHFVDVARGKPYDRLCALDTGGGFVPIPATTPIDLAVTPADGYGGFQYRIDVTPLAASCPGTPSGSTTTTVTVVVRFAGIGGIAGGSPIWDTTLVTIRAQ
jgi:prepilin-type N-terminal cleavage/methylation domain-containing protein